MGSHVRIVRLQHEHWRRPQQQGLDYTAQITSTISHPFGVPGRELGYCVHHRAPGRVGSTTCIASRHRAFSLLELLLRATAGVVGDGDGWDTMSFYQLSASVRQKAEECEHVQCGHRFGCHHLQRILSDAMDSKTSDGANVLAKIIVSCMKAKRCPAAVAQLVDMTSKLETILSENFDDIGIDDPLSENTDLRASKRRRLDKERKSALMYGPSMRKRGKLSSRCARAGERLVPTTLLSGFSRRWVPTSGACGFGSKTCRPWQLHLVLREWACLERRRCP